MKNMNNQSENQVIYSIRMHQQHFRHFNFYSFESHAKSPKMNKIINIMRANIISSVYAQNDVHCTYMLLRINYGICKQWHYNNRSTKIIRFSCYFLFCIFRRNMKTIFNIAVRIKIAQCVLFCCIAWTLLFF